MISIKLLVPAEHVALFGKLERSRGLELESQPLLDFVAKPLRAFLFQHILKARMFAVRAVAKIAVHCQDCLG